MTLDKAKEAVDVAFTATDRRGLAYENAFGGATSFLRRTYTKDLSGYDLAVTGVPFDQAVTHRPGTRFGPRAIREASSLQPFDPPPHGRLAQIQFAAQLTGGLGRVALQLAQNFIILLVQNHSGSTLSALTTATVISASMSAIWGNCKTCVR